MDPATVLSLIAAYRYPILVPVALLAGFPTGMAVGILIHAGLLLLIPAYFCIMLGELIGDVFWYWAGYAWGERFIRRFGEYVGLSQGKVDATKRLFVKHDQTILLSSKLTTGFGFAIPILFTAGMAKMSFFRYMRANISGQFLWSGGLILIGYFFGDLYTSVNGVFGKISALTLAALALLGAYGFLHYLWNRFARSTR